MIMYTIMPAELVYPTQESDYAKQMNISYKGVPLLVEQQEDHSYQVVRVLSTDPQHFLNENISPGAKISLEYHL